MTRAGEGPNVAGVVAIGISGEGFREILGICEGAKEDRRGEATFSPISRSAVSRRGGRVTSDARLGVVASIGEFRVVGAFLDGGSALNLAAASLRRIAGTHWSNRRYVTMQPLHEQKPTAKIA